MTIQTNDPFPIRCPTPPPKGLPLESCRNMRKNIPAGGQIQSFGPRGAEVDVPLSFNFYSGKTFSEETNTGTRKPIFDYT